MKHFSLGIMAAILLLAGSVLRLEMTDWNRSGQLERTGVRLTPGEALMDRDIRSRFPLETGSELSGGGQASILSAKHTIMPAEGYTRFLTLCYRLFGSRGEPPLLPVQILQNMMNALSLFFLLAIIRMTVNQPWLAMLAGSLYYLHPVVIRSSSGYNSEALYTCMTLILVYCAVSFFKQESATARRSLAYGCGLGTGIAFHPLLLAYAFLFAAVAGLLCFLTRRKTVSYLLMMVTCLYVLCAAWW